MGREGEGGGEEREERERGGREGYNALSCTHMYIHHGDDATDTPLHSPWHVPSHAWSPSFLDKTAAIKK